MAETLSAMTPAEGTTETSALSTSALAFLLFFMFTDCKGFFNVAIGFMAARSTMFSPFVMPPSIPPELLFFLKNFLVPLSKNISSCTSEPGFRETSNPRPISTALIPGIDMIALARFASSLLSHWV